MNILPESNRNELKYPLKKAFMFPSVIVKLQVLKHFTCNSKKGDLVRWPLVGVMNGPLKFLTARKILPLLDLLAKFK